MLARPEKCVCPCIADLQASAHDRLLKDFSCGLCKAVLDQPLSMPCGHNFCKKCLDSRFAEQEAAAGGSKALQEAKPARALRQRKVSSDWWCMYGILNHSQLQLLLLAPVVQPLLAGMHNLGCIQCLPGSSSAAAAAGPQALPHLQD